MTGPSAASRADGAAVRIVTAVIAALAVVGVVLVMALTDTSAAPAAQGGGGNITGGANASDGSDGIAGSSGTGGSSGDSGAVPTTAELEAEFPLPPGASRIPTPDFDKYGSAGAKFYQVRGTLESVRGFYVSKLAQLGVPLGTPATVTSGGTVVGYFYSYISSTLDLDLNLGTSRGEGVPAGTVRIKVTFGP